MGPARGRTRAMYCGPYPMMTETLAIFNTDKFTNSKQSFFCSFIEHYTAPGGRDVAAGQADASASGPGADPDDAIQTKRSAAASSVQRSHRQQRPSMFRMFEREWPTINYKKNYLLLLLLMEGGRGASSCCSTRHRQAAR